MTDKPQKSQTKAAKAGRKRTAKRRRTQKELLAEARIAVFERDGFRCLYVSDSGLRCPQLATLQLCHVFSRRYVSIRHDPINLMTLCAAHHIWWHDRPPEAGLWFVQHYPERYTALREKVKSGLKTVEAAVPMPRDDYGEVVSE